MKNFHISPAVFFAVIGVIAGEAIVVVDSPTLQTVLAVIVFVSMIGAGIFLAKDLRRFKKK